MNYDALNSKPINSTHAQAGDVVRELVAAMPIVIFAKALRAALQRPTRVGTTLRTSTY